jgi:hypothetical protein
MATDYILAQIDAEIAKLQQVRSLLANTGKVSAKLTERVTRKAAAPVVAKAKVKKSRVLSPEARKRIADAQKKRWAAQKAKA